MPMPGDDLVRPAMVQATHAVTIGAPPQQVWPWLVQTGQGRAGLHSDSPFWDRCVDWYYHRLSREQPGQAAAVIRSAPPTGSSRPGSTFR